MPLTFIFIKLLLLTLGMGLITVEAHPNIAFVKYWGQRNPELFLPHNSSISATINSSLVTRTSLFTSASLKADEVFLNKEKALGERFERILRQVRYLRATRQIPKDQKVRIATVNSFPTGAGIASSASGFAAIAVALNSAFGLGLDDRGLSILARIGSGSASRSVFGGFAIWHRGVSDDGSDSYAEQVKPEDFWPELRDLIVIVESRHKKVSSAEGMQRTVNTAPKYFDKVAEAEARVRAAHEYLLEKDFEGLAGEIMADSERMHSLIANSTPKFSYLNKASEEIVDVVREFNVAKTRAAYTFDAGPNAHVITLEKEVEKLKNILKGIPGVIKIVEGRIGGAPRIITHGALLDEKGNLA